MHQPKVGERCKLGGLEFEVIETNSVVFRTFRINSYTHLIQEWSAKDADAFTWPEPEAVWTQGHLRELEEVLKEIARPSGTQSIVYEWCSTDSLKDFIRFRIKK